MRAGVAAEVPFSAGSPNDSPEDDAGANNADDKTFSGKSVIINMIHNFFCIFQSILY